MAGASKQPAAEICLYGTSEIGAGYIAALPDGRMFGDGEPRKGRIFTSAIFLACDDLRSAGVTGTARVYDTCGSRAADISIERPTYYGVLEWTAPVTVYVLGADEILKAVNRPAGGAWR